MTTIPIEVSGHHIHISKNDLYKLFGESYKLTSIKDLSQKGQFACEEKVVVSTEAGKIKGLRIAGPEREATQVEITKTDAYILKIDPPVKECTTCVGEKAAAVKITGPKGSIKRDAAIIAHRHIHLSSKESDELNLKEGEKVSVRTEGDRAITFHNVLIRVDESFVKNMHLDTDEANAAGIEKKATGEIIK